MPLIGREKVDKAIDSLVGETNNRLRAVYFTGLAKVIKETPVDSGRARNNWFLSANAPSDSVTTSTSKGLSAIRELDSMPKNIMNKKVFLTNNLPYIGVLEYGGYPEPGTEKTINGFSSQIAPDGWVRKALLFMRKEIRKI